jgi:hypothetical protein
MHDKARERTLESALLFLYEAWADLPITTEHPRPYYAERFRQTIVPECKRYKGGVQAVRDILGKREVDTRRFKCYPDLTVEYLVSSGKWDDLFNPADRTLARLRLKKIQSLTTTSGASRSQLPRSGPPTRGATAASASLGTRHPAEGMDENGGDWEYTRRRLDANGSPRVKNSLEEI